MEANYLHTPLYYYPQPNISQSILPLCSDSFVSSIQMVFHKSNLLLLNPQILISRLSLIGSLTFALGKYHSPTDLI